MRYSLFLVTAPTVEPVSVTELRTHCRIDDTDGEPAPTALTAALISPAAAGNVDNGAHRYVVTFVTAAGETEAGAVSSAVTVSDKTTNGKVALTAIPTGGSLVTSRKIYRTTAGGSTYYLLTTLSDNSTTTYTDNTADSGLGAQAPSTNTTENPKLGILIKAAREYAERVCNRRFINSTWDLKLDYFPCEIRLPYPPLSSVTSISYVDTNGDTQTVSSSVYSVDASSEPGVITLAYGQDWPSARDQRNAVTVRYVAGYGASSSSVPESVRQAIMLIAAHWFEQREEVISGTIISKVPMAAESLLWVNRILEAA